MTDRGQRTRERLLSVAEQQLVAERGTLDVDRVAAAAGVSVGGLYHHFASKEELLAAVVEGFHDRYDSAVLFADLADAGDWATRERERVRRAVRFYYDEPLAKVLLSRAGVDGAIARVDTERLQLAAHASAANLREAQRAGELPGELDCAHAGAMLMGGVALVLARALEQSPPPPAAELTDSLWRMVAGVVGLDRAA